MPVLPCGEYYECLALRLKSALVSSLSPYVALAGMPIVTVPLPNYLHVYGRPD